MKQATANPFNKWRATGVPDRYVLTEKDSGKVVAYLDYGRGGYTTVKIVRGGDHNFKANTLQKAKAEALKYVRQDFSEYRDYRDSQPKLADVNRYINQEVIAQHGKVKHISPRAFTTDVYELEFEDGYTQDTKIPKFRNPHGFAIVDQHLNIIARGKDYDTLQKKVDRHNEESGDRWFVVDESDLKETSKRNPKERYPVAGTLTRRDIKTSMPTTKTGAGTALWRSNGDGFETFVSGKPCKECVKAINDGMPVKAHSICEAMVRGQAPIENPSAEFKQAIADERDRTQAELDALDALGNPANPSEKKRLESEYRARYGITGKFTKDDALGVIDVYGIDLNSDFHALRGDDVRTLYDLAVLTGYRHRDVTGKSYTRAFFDSIGRYAARRNPTNPRESYRVVKYGREWAILAFPSNAYVLFGKKREMEQRARELNAAARNPRAKNASYSEVDFFDDKAIDQLSAEFQGSISGETFEAVAADSTPKSLARLGHLRKIVVGDFEINFDDTEDAWLAADRRKNLYFVGKDARLSSGQKPRKGQLKHLGKVSQVNYVTEKAHIENGSTTEYFHEFGEVDGAQPDLFVDHDNMLTLVGGNYDIWTCGIVN